MQTLASDLSGLLSEEHDSQLLLLQLPCKKKGKVDHGEKKGQKSDCSYLKDDHSVRFFKTFFLSLKHRLLTVMLLVLSAYIYMRF